MRKFALLAGVAAAAFVLAHSTPTAHAQVKCGPNNQDLCIGSKNTRLRVLGGLTLEGSPAHADGGLTMTVSSKGSLVYDFPALPTGGLITAGNSHICADSVTTASLPGCTFNDTLLLGIDQTYPATFGQCEPYISAAETGKVRCCGFQNDAGAFNMPDASYTIRCIR